MPPQGVALIVGAGGPLVWNYARSRQGKPTISMKLREHPIAFVGGLLAANVVLNGWLPRHIFND